MDQDIVAQLVNAPVIAHFRRNSYFDPVGQTYQSHAHPDLIEELRSVMKQAGLPVVDIVESSVYGWPVAANRLGVIFAWTGGTSDFFLRLGQERIQAACAEGARLDNSYPPGWLNFYLRRLGENWRDVLKRWVRAAYEDATRL